MELDVRGTPAWQIREYLRQLGGTPNADDAFTGPDWTATLEELEFQAFGTMLPRVIIRLNGDGAEAVLAGLRLRSMRVGG